jgi:nucleosome binding factor SPN SPT16 subunit
LAKARLDPDFKYFSNAIARDSSSNAIQIFDANFDVCVTSPEVCFESLASRSSVMPV